MNQRTIHNLTWLPILIIGIVSVGLGGLWCLHPEPWLLDQLPNEILLQTKFSELFSANINVHLPDYLIVIYRFFGWWLIALGLLIITYLLSTRMGTKFARDSINMVLFIVLVGLYYLVFSFIPKSPLVPTLYGFTLLLSCSVYFSRRLDD